MVITPAAPPARHQLLDTLADVLAALAELDPAEAAPEALTVDLMECEVALRRLVAINARWLACFDAREYAQLVLGLSSTRQFMTSYLRAGRNAISRRLSAARKVFQSRGSGHEAQARTLSLTEEHWVRGELEDGHVAVIGDTHQPFVDDLISHGLDAEEIVTRAAEAEQAMVAAALTADPETLRKHTAHIREQFLPEAIPAKEAILWRDRWLKLAPMANGHTKVSGALMPETALLLGRALEQLGTSRGEEDDRLPTQLAHDALGELALAALDAVVDASSAATLRSGADQAAADSLGTCRTGLATESEGAALESAAACAAEPRPASDDADGSAAASGSDAPAPALPAFLLQSLSHLELVYGPRRCARGARWLGTDACR